jgi:putative FmdB family regulatory protein
MPIYAYRCQACGFSKDVLQKMSDAPLTTCPECHAESFTKQVTAAGFQLKGSGWYVTDFRNQNSGAAPAKKESGDSVPESSGSNNSAASGDATASGKSNNSTAAGSDSAAAAPAASNPTNPTTTP